MDKPRGSSLLRFNVPMSIHLAHHQSSKVSDSASPILAIRSVNELMNVPVHLASQGCFLAPGL